MPYCPHSFAGYPPEAWQGLAEHLVAVAKRTARRGDESGAGKAACLAGALHDRGKYMEGFKRRLMGREAVDRSTPGAREVLALADPSEFHLAEPLAHAIAGHHGGVPDRCSRELPTLDTGLGTPSPGLAAVWRDDVGLVCGNAGELTPANSIFQDMEIGVSLWPTASNSA